MIWQVLLMVAWSAGPEASAEQRRLSGREISHSLVGKHVTYGLPGAVAGVHEEFDRGGIWQGLRYIRGPVGFSGRWKVEGDRLCVHAEDGLPGSLWEQGWVCREVWRDPNSRSLFMKPLMGGGSPVELTVHLLANGELK